MNKEQTKQETVSAGDLEKAIQEAEKLAKGEATEGDTVEKKTKPKHSQVKEEEQDEGDDERKTDTDEVAGTHTTEGKSLAMNPDVQKAVNVSGWIAGVTEQLDTLLTSHDLAIKSLGERTEGSLGKLAEATRALAKGYTHQTELLAKLAERVDALERQPQPRKSIAKSIPGVPVERQFEAPGESDGPTLNKAQVLDVLTDKVRKGEMSVVELTRFEATGELSMRARHLLGARS